MRRVLKAQAPMSPAAEAYAATVLRLTREVQARARVELDIPYGPGDEQRLDLYLPDSPPASPAPVLLFMHGGGWRNGYKEWMGFMAPAITCLPAIFVSVEYRLAPDAKFPAAVEDCRGALAWTYRNIDGYGGDPDRLFVGGHSAGGHLAGLLALQRQALIDGGLPENVVKGCFPVSGVFDLSDTSSAMAQAFLRSAKDAAQASPVRQVAGNRVPFFITIGGKDLPHLIPQCGAMAAALEREAGPVRVLEMKDCDHFQINIQGAEVDGEWATTVRQWMADPPAARV